MRPPMAPQVECEFEAEVLAAVLQSRWPARAEVGLRAHADTCAICADVAAIAGAIDAARDETRACATLPESGRVWWLAQMRARREASTTAGRPITAVQVIAFASAVGTLGACFGATSTWFQSLLARFSSNAAGFKLQSLVPPTTSLIAQHGWLILAATAMLLVVPAAVY